MGRYSPNGCTISLSWRSAGPVTGFHTITVLVYSGVSCGRPGNVEDGADQDRRADRVRRLGDLLGGVGIDVSGSMSEAFSGQMTNCGCGAVPGAHVLGQPQRLIGRGCPAPLGVAH